MAVKKQRRRSRKAAVGRSPTAASPDRRFTRPPPYPTALSVGGPLLSLGRVAGRGYRIYVPPPRGAVAQLGERLDRTQEVRGSSPLSSTVSCSLRPSWPSGTKCAVRRARLLPAPDHP